MIPRDRGHEIPLHIGLKLQHERGPVHIVTKIEDIGDEELGARVSLEGPNHGVAWQRALGTHNGWNVAS